MFLKFFSVFSHTLVMPYTVVYFSERVGSKMTTILIIAIAIISIVGYIVGGKLTDQIGRKKVIVFNEVFSGLGFILVAFLNSFSTILIVPIFVAFCFIYFFETAANPAYSALIIDASEEDNRKEIYTYFMWITTVAFSLGSLIGGFYFENHATLLFLIVGILLLVSSIFTILIIKDNYIQQTNHLNTNLESTHDIESNTKKTNDTKMFSKLFILLCSIQVLLSTLNEQFPNYLSIRFVKHYPLEDFDVTGYQVIGYLNFEETLIVSIGSILIIKLVNKISESKSLYLGVILFICGNIILSYFIHFYALLYGMFLVSIGGIVYIPTLQAYTAKLIPENSRGQYLSTLGMMSVFGGVLASLFIWGMDYINENFISGIYLAIGLLLIVLLNGITKSQPN